MTGPVKSPTYTLVEMYETPTVSIVHLDLYRLLDPEELEPLGLREFARPGYIWLIEWPDRGTGRLPFPDLSVTLSGGMQRSRDQRDRDFRVRGNHGCRQLKTVRPERRLRRN